MGKILRSSCMAALLLAAPAFAQNVTVDAVQYPAWLQRGGHAVPLTPGMALQARDEVRTGPEARVRLRLAEGSAVRLGENARFVVDRAEGGGSLLRAALRVISGAIRFTTDPRSGGRRDVSLRVRNVSAGIRGTDVWGKSTDERDLVCLLEGAISVSSEGHEAVTLSSPLDFYVKAPGKPPQVSKVDAAQVERWAQETEFAPDGAVAARGGRWRVVAAVFRSRDEALRLRARLRQEGYPAEVGPREAYFAVHVPGFEGEAQARAAMANLRELPGVALPHVLEVK